MAKQATGSAANTHLLAALLARRLLVVTGKGGVGKTAVAAALALAAARRGSRTVLVELARRDHAARALGGESGPEETQLTECLYTICIDPQRAMEEYLVDQVPLPGIAERLGANRALVQLGAAMPGLRELLAMGKVWELAQPERRSAGMQPYDLVVVDAAATGHGIGFLTAAQRFARGAGAGPIAHQAELINALVVDPELTGIVAVAAPSEASVSETIGLQEKLRAELAVELAGLVVNGLQARHLGSGEEQVLRTAAAELRANAAELRANPLAAAGPSAGGHPSSPAIAIEIALAEDEVAQLEATELQRLRDACGLETLELPRLSTSEIGRAEVELLADWLENGADRSSRSRGARGAGDSRPAASEHGRRGAARRLRAPTPAYPDPAPRLAAALADKRIIVCAGAGGVGKTTLAATIGLGLAREGRRVAVLTIDPAGRLTAALGLEALDGEPHRLDPELCARLGVDGNGELWAMVHDGTRAFDDLIAELAPDAATRGQLMANRIYRQLSTSATGSREFTAVAKLYELERSGLYDAIVLDTPPSRNALDFLHAPQRITQVLDHAALRLLTAPAGLAARLALRGSEALLQSLERILGGALLGEAMGFVRAIGGLADGFRARAEAVDALLRGPDAAFLVITSPEAEPRAEAAFFRRRLSELQMPFAGLIVNRVNALALDPEEGAEAAASLRVLLGEDLAELVAERVAAQRRLVERDRAAIDELMGGLGVVGAAGQGEWLGGAGGAGGAGEGGVGQELIVVPRLRGEVSDVESLARLVQVLFGERAGPAG